MNLHGLTKSDIEVSIGKGLLYIPTTRLSKMKKPPDGISTPPSHDFSNPLGTPALTRQIGVAIVCQFSHNWNPLDLNNRSFVARPSASASSNYGQQAQTKIDFDE